MGRVYPYIWRQQLARFAVRIVDIACFNSRPTVSWHILPDSHVVQVSIQIRSLKQKIASLTRLIDNVKLERFVVHPCKSRRRVRWEYWRYGSLIIRFWSLVTAFVELSYSHGDLIIFVVAAKAQYWTGCSLMPTSTSLLPYAFKARVFKICLEPVQGASLHEKCIEMVTASEINHWCGGMEYLSAVEIRLSFPSYWVHVSSNYAHHWHTKPVKSLSKPECNAKYRVQL